MSRSRNRLLICALLLVACSPEDQSPFPVAKNALLVTFDTTRQDAIDGFGHRTGVTPNLAHLASEGVRYLQARTVAPITLPAHASILTGLYPLRHGVRINGAESLPPEARTLAEHAREAGFDTAAFVAAVVLARQFGLDQGFDVYDLPKGQIKGEIFSRGERRADAVTEAAIGWLRERQPDGRFFLWVHYFDPHTPFEAGWEFTRQREEGDLPGENEYLAEVAQADAALGKLLAELRVLGLYEETAIAVVGDHGESLGEHGEETHGALCFDSTLRVPLILRTPDGFRAGEASDEVTSVVDLYPTLLGLLGLAPGEDSDGIDLRDGPVSPERGVYFESYYGFQNFGWSPLTGWARRDSKYLRASREVVFAPDVDASEEHPIAAADDSAVRDARENIERLAALPKLSGGVGVDAEVVAQLASLGYATGPAQVGALPHPLAPSDLPSPMDSMPELDRMNRADALLNTGQFESGIELVEKIVQANPGNVYAQRILASALERVGRTAEAALGWERVIGLGDTSVPTRLRLAGCLTREGELERASALFEQVLEQDPRNQEAMQQLLKVAVLARDARRAREYRLRFGQALDAAPAR